MLQKNTVDFLKELKKNNTREWMDANKKKYEAAKDDFLNFTVQVLQGVAKFDEDLVGLDAKKCVFRIHRDVRFSKDKSPYKTNMGMHFSKGGKSSSHAGYYFHLEPDACFIGGGIYMPMPDVIQKIRQEIDYNFNYFNSIITQKKFAATFADLSFNEELSLKKVPKGYEDNNAAIKYLKLKSWIVSASVANKDLLAKELAANAVNTFKTMKPFIDFLNAAIDE